MKYTFNATCGEFTGQRIPLRCPTNFISVRVHDFMSQRFRATVNRKRKSQARLHVARWSSRSVAFSLALFNRVWNNYTLPKSHRDTFYSLTLRSRAIRLRSRFIIFMATQHCFKHNLAFTWRGKKKNNEGSARDIFANNERVKQQKGNYAWMWIR